VPNARLLLLRNTLHGRARQRLDDQFKAAGVADRVVLHNHFPPGGHLYAYHGIDIALDTFPWTGHTTACEALWMGAPTVTLRGQTRAGRLVASALTQAGLPHWIAHNDEQYVAIAAAAAANLGDLRELRRSLRPAMQRSRLCDARPFTAEFETSLRRIWSQRCAGG
jgi:predicted O-linked N-acetylglucosamine transferase (SPINDLY family)